MSRFAKAAPLRRDQFYRILHALADKYRPAFSKAVLAALEQTRKASTYRAVERALETRDINTVISVLGLDDLEQRLADNIRASLVGLYGAAAGATVEKLKLKMSFDLVNPHSVDFLQRYQFGLVRSIAEESKDALRQTLMRAFVAGGPVAQTARAIRPIVGLLPRDAMAVGNYWSGMVEQGVDLGRAEVMAGKYAERLINQRAEVIARTETIRAAGAGREAAWAQAIERGLLDPRRWKRFWLVTDDDRLCPACENIPLYNDEGVGFDEPFETDGDPIMQEPLHPNCRCSISVREVEPTTSVIITEDAA